MSYNQNFDDPLFVTDGWQVGSRKNWVKNIPLKKQHLNVNAQFPVFMDVVNVYLPHGPRVGIVLQVRQNYGNNKAEKLGD